MSILADKSERKAIAVLANTLRYFDKTTLLNMSATDANDARAAENLVKGIIEANGYETRLRNGKNIIRKTTKNQSR